MLDIRNVRKTFNPGTVNEKIALRGVSLLPGAAAELLSKAPLASMGLGWVAPAVLGAAIGILLSLAAGRRRAETP